MNPPSEPKISIIKINGRRYFRLTYWTPAGRHREHFAREGDAKKRQRQLIQDAERFGRRAEAMTATQRADAIAALEILEGSGFSLTEAARRLVETIRREQAGIPLEEAVTAFLRSRDSRAGTYKSTLAGRLRLFANYFPGATTAQISVEACQRFLDAIAARNSPRTVMHYRTHLHAFFSFCIARGWASANPAKQATTPRVTTPDVGILTPAEANRLLENADPCILPGIAIGLFAGLRWAEIQRLDWRAINLPARALTVGAAIAKTGSRRVVPIGDALSEWLAPHSRESGPVWPPGEQARTAWKLARIAAGFGPFFSTRRAVKEAQAGRTDLRPWPHNALRHSFISYWLALEGDLPRLAYISGNSPTVIQGHYNGLALFDEAKTYFSTRPATAPNVLPLPAIKNAAGGA